MFLQPSEIEPILQPCSDEDSAGHDLRADRSSFRPLRNKYNIARTSFRQLMLEPDPEARDELRKLTQQQWGALCQQLVEVLSRQSKDLELISWLCEGQLFSETPWLSLKAALEVLAQTVGRYWGECHPGAALESEDDNPDIGRRVGLLRTLFGEGGDTGLLVLPMRMAVLAGDTTLGDCLAAERRGETTALKNRLAPRVTEDGEVLRQRVEQIYEIRLLVEGLDARLLSLCEGQWHSGAMQSFIDQIKSINRWLDFLCADQLPAWPAGLADKPALTESQEHGSATNGSSNGDDEPAAPADAENRAVGPEAGRLNAGSAAPVYIAGSIQSREDAYRQLRHLANYFRRSEPHSPVTCLLERALGWGKMSLQELMKELLAGHQHALERVDDLTGLLRPLEPAADDGLAGYPDTADASLWGGLMPQAEAADHGKGANFQQQPAPVMQQTQSPSGTEDDNARRDAQSKAKSEQNNEQNYEDTDSSRSSSQPGLPSSDGKPADDRGGYTNQQLM